MQHTMRYSINQPVHFHYHIYSRISHPTYKPTPIPATDDIAKTSDPRISWYSGSRRRTSTLDLCIVTPRSLRKPRLWRCMPTHPARTRTSAMRPPAAIQATALVCRHSSSSLRVVLPPAAHAAVDRCLLMVHAMVHAVLTLAVVL